MQALAASMPIEDKPKYRNGYGFRCNCRRTRSWSRSAPHVIKLFHNNNNNNNGKQADILIGKVCGQLNPKLYIFCYADTPAAAISTQNKQCPESQLIQNVACIARQQLPLYFTMCSAILLLSNIKSMTLCKPYLKLTTKI